MSWVWASVRSRLTMVSAVCESRFPAGSSATDDAVRGLVSLGYARADADRAVRAAIDNGSAGAAAPELIRVALRHLQR